MSKTDCLKKIKVKLNVPIEKNGLYITYINIPCGKCERCITRRKIEWGFRMENELNNSKTAYFVTLTYSPETVPYKYKTYDSKNKKWKVQKCVVKTLNPYHLTKFFKRLRQNEKRSVPTMEHYYHNLDPKKDKISYYAAGEYGENYTIRPHYHAIVFNASEQNILKAWKKGNVHIVPANRQTIAYVMKYLDKRIGTETDFRKYPEYNTMSEGIGIRYIEKNIQWHRQNLDILYVTNSRGIKIPMPRYYRDKMFSEDEKRIQQLHVEITLLENKNELIEKIGIDNYNKLQNNLIRNSKHRFEKNIKKRTID